jgi:hypothetical protein
LSVGWRSTLDTKEKGHIAVAKISSLNSGMMITNARLSYTQTRSVEEFSLFLKNLSEVT